MPIYEFMCNQCGHQHDEYIRYNPDIVAIDCPHCETKTSYRLPSIPAPARGDFGTVNRRPRQEPRKAFRPDPKVKK